MALATQSPAHPARREPRFGVRLAATLLRFRDRMDVTVTDLSRGGALLEGDALPAKGDEVVLTRARFQAVATVAWREDHACGLSFHCAIDPAELLGRRKGMARSAS